MSTRTPTKRPAPVDDDHEYHKKQKREPEEGGHRPKKPAEQDGQPRSPRRDRPSRSRSPHRHQQSNRTRSRDRNGRERDEPRNTSFDYDREKTRVQDRDQSRGTLLKSTGAKPGRRRDARPEAMERGRARSPGKSGQNNATNGVKHEPREDMDIDTDGNMDMELMRSMGFKKFKTTQNTKVPGNDRLYGISKEKKTEYRQYMNRTGGFNRPLSPS